MVNNVTITLEYYTVKLVGSNIIPESHSKFVILFGKTILQATSTCNNASTLLSTAILVHEFLQDTEVVGNSQLSFHQCHENKTLKNFVHEYKSRRSSHTHH